LWILRYHRSRFFTFLFFMQKLSGNSLDKFNKSCSTFHQESKKTWVCIFLNFLRISMDFTRISKCLILLKMSFCKKIPGGFDSLQIRPQFADWPSERFRVLQCGPRGSWPSGSPESGEFAGVRGRERAGRESPPPKGSLSGLGRVRKRAGEWSCRRPAAVAARSSAPASSRPGIEKGRRAWLYVVLGEVSGWSNRRGNWWAGVPTTTVAMARAAEQ
jgi:hypothetical protein